MIIDAHCHAWRQWPYQPAVPDPDSRASAGRLVWEMDQAGVERAVLIAAAIDGNPDNNGYTSECARSASGRLIAFPAVDCRWEPTHHTPGADARLRQVVQRFNPAGFTHYLHEDADPAWLLSPDGLAFFAVAETSSLICSLACGPGQLPAVGLLASRFPTMPFLIHHLGRVKAEPLDAEGMRALIDISSVPNVHIKLSGFGYAVPDGWNFPCTPAHALVKVLYQQFGASRLCWGSDYPVSQSYMTYRQALEVVRTHCDFIPASEMQQVLGGSLQAVLDRDRSTRTQTP